MKILSFAFPSNETLQHRLEDEFTVLDGNLNVIQSYFESASIDMDGNPVVRGYTMYGYNDEDQDEYIYMVIGWNCHNNSEFHVDEDFIEPGGFDMIDEAHDYLKSIHQVILIEEE